MFVPSPYQAAFFEWIKTDTGHAFLDAGPGSGKTTTAIESCKLFTGSVLFVAFNKKIVEEIKTRLAALGLPNVEAATYHSAGFKACRGVYKGVKVDARAKNDRLCQDVGLPAHLQAFVFEIVSHAKNRAMFEDQIDNVSLWHDIVDHFDLAEKLENPQDMPKAIALAQETLRRSIEIAPNLIDFDDMIYLPVIKGMRVWQYDVLINDEAQDTNECRRLFARMLLKPNGRSVWVGDRCQSIYGFTGADAEAVDLIIRDFNCTVLPLTVSYRCPKSVVECANNLGLRKIEAHENAAAGVVSTINEAEFRARPLLASDAILCRKTAPIVALAFALIKKGTACHVEGRDIGQGLLKLATRWKIKNVPALLDKLAEYKEREVAKLVAKGRETQAEALADRVETLVVLADGCDTVDCVKEKIERLFQDNTPTLTLATMHRSKGREWNNVYLYGYSQWSPSKYARQAWQLVQEKNLQYVAITRAKQTLTFVNVAA